MIENALFCTACGARLGQPRPTSSRRAWWFVAGTGALLAVVAAAALVAGRDGKQAAPSPSVAAQDRMSPEQVRDVLLQTPLDPSEVPQGLGEPKVGERELRPEDRRHNIISIVDVDLLSTPDYQTYIAYAIYPTVADARTAFVQADRPVRTEQLTSRFRPGGSFGVPAQCLQWNAPHVDAPQARFGVTECQARAGRIVVLGASVLQSVADKGDDEHAQSLLRAGLAHLDRVRAKSA